MAIPMPEATLLGVLQGITEVLPVSGDGHLALARLLFGGHGDPAAEAFLNLGTLSATLFVLRKRVRSALIEGIRGILRPSLLKETPGGRDAVVLALATIPTAIVGLSLKTLSPDRSGSPTLLGVCFLVSALAVGSTYWAPKGERHTPRHLGALLAGLAQGIAVLPGLSRSGITLATLLWLGIASERAFELSFLLSLPALTVGALLGARVALYRDDEGAILLYAAALVCVVGVGALEVLRGALLRRILWVFAVYLVPLGVATLAWGYARP